MALVEVTNLQIYDNDAHEAYKLLVNKDHVVYIKPFSITLTTGETKNLYQVFFSNSLSIIVSEADKGKLV